MPALYYISDHSYQNLTQMGQRQGYIRLQAARAHGMTDFLDALSKSNFQDTRPNHVKIRHESEIRNFRAPTWTSYFQRRTRLLSISDEAMARFIQIALSFGIIEPKPFAVGGPSRLTMIPTTSLVLEGIGLGWITPVNLPLKVK